MATSIVQEIISLFYPHICPSCEKPIHKLEWRICLTCRSLLPRTKYEFIDDNPVEKILMGKCHVEGAFSFFYFKKSNSIQKLIHALKYKGMITIGIELGEIIGQHLKNNRRFNTPTWIIPVPLHPSKKRLRGYNQCDSIATGIGKQMQIETCLDHVSRIKSTTSQTNKGHYERFKNVEETFQITQPEQFVNNSVLIVDDVITTGSTLASLVREFNKIEGCKVYVCTVAIAS